MPNRECSFRTVVCGSLSFFPTADVAEAGDAPFAAMKLTGLGRVEFLVSNLTTYLCEYSVLHKFFV